MNKRFGSNDESGVFSFAPDTLKINGYTHFSPLDSEYRDAGYRFTKDEPPTPAEGFYAAPTGKWENEGEDYIVKQYELKPIEVTPRHLSKYSFIKNLKADGLFEEFMDFVKSDDYTYQLWLSAEYLDEGDDTFKDCRWQAKAALGVDDATIDAFLAKVEEA